MKSTTNVFLDGLITDRHPLSTPQNCLTDALNATLLTYNGNEMMLLNDMGNTRILDSATGNIMSLSPGFIPVGMKEHGGIMYIASVNKEGEGEIGTIPSPIIRDFYKDKQLIFIDKKLSNASYVSISNKIYPADKIIINLGLTVRTDEIVGNIYNEVTNKSPVISPGSTFVEIDPCDYYIERFCIIPPYKCFDLLDLNPIKDARITAPIISYSPNTEKRNLTFNKGIFKLKLASKSVTNVETEAPSFLYEALGDSNYWFYHTDNISHIFPSDLFEATLNKSLKSFPTDSKPGYLQVKLLNEGIKTFGMLQRKKHPIDTPITIKIKDSEYETYFPGFYYNTESGIYVSKIQCKVFNLLTRDYCKIHLADGTSVEEADIYFDVLSISGVEIKSVVGFVELAISKDNYSLLTPIVKHAHDNHHLIYPQLYNSETGDFYLTNLTDIEKIHTQYKSSTLNNDGSNITPYSGLFKIKLDETTYSHWHKLTVSYYNLYNEKIGEYECVFNPLLNDVFGSNVNLKNVLLPELKTIGKEKNIKAVDINLVTTIPDGNFIFRRTIGSDSSDPVDDGYIKANGMVLVTSLDSISSGVIPSFEDNRYNWSLQIKTDEEISIQDLKTAYRLDNQYMYNLYYQTFLSKNIKILDILDAELSIGIDIDNVELSKMYTYNKNTTVLQYVKLDELQVRSDCYMSCDEIESCKESLPKIQWSYYSSNSENLDKIPGFVGTQNHKIKDYAPIQLNMDTIFPQDLDTLINNFDSFKGNITLSSEDFYFGSSYMSVSDMRESLMENYIYWWYKGEYESSEKTNLGLEFNIKYNPKPYTLWSIPLQIQTPLYKIAPYFLLTDGDKQYVNKFYLTDPIFYKCNFTSNNGIPINYIPEAFGLTEPIDDYTAFSYAQPQHKILSETATVSAQSLDPGIYVFNITAPSITDLLKDPTLPLSITIKIGERESTLNPYRSAGSTQISYQKSNGYGITMPHLWPIVVYVDKTSNIDISVNISDGLELRYQKIGLYKLDNLPEMINGDIVTNFNNNCCCLFPDYQLIVLNIADNLPKEDQYIFKQTYGIFFRQSYSYVEGLYDSSKDIFKHQELLNVIRPITIGDTTYPNKAFVPAEPYILNYMWDKTPERKEPKVFKPCSAACLYCQPKEILTNRQETKFKFFPTMENTEDCLTTQIRTFVLSDTAISCQPGNSTVLIKKNNANEN